MMDTPSWPSILTRLNKIDDVWNLFDAANATNAVRATVRTGGPYARLVMRGASYALFTVGGRDVVCEASLQYQNADASSCYLEDPAFDEYANDEDALDLTAGDDGEGAINLEREADEVFDRWMKHVTSFNDYLYKGAKEIKNVNNCGPNELIDKFDTQKFFREYGRQNFLAIVILARMYFSQFETGSEQERVFSSARLAMGKDQTNMGFEMFKMRTLLSHNKDLICAGIIKI